MALKILIADDDAAFRTWAHKTLSDNGFDVTVAVDGEAAVQVGLELVPNLFLIDVVMPKLLGTEVCMEFRRVKETKEIPLVFLVAKDHELKEVNAIEDEDQRAEDILRKPVSSATLLRVSKKWAQRKRIMGPIPGSERRKTPRVPADILSSIQDVLEETADPASSVVGPLPPGRVISISEGGAFVLTDKPLPEGAELSLVLSVPGAEEAINAKARVVYIRGGAEPGMGVVFVDLPDADRSRIRLYVDVLRRLVRQ